MVSIFSGWWKAGQKGELSLDDIRAARERLKDVLPPTPLTHSPALSDMAGHEVYLKWENRHRTGSFKERGACNRLATLDSKAASHGVCAVSAGNHALALSYHAKRAGVQCHIVMPVNAPLIKVELTRRNGAQVTLHGANFDEALDHALKLAKEKSLTFVSPFDDAAVIAGQGTAALELMDQLPDFDSVIVPVGGGGLISGIATVLKAARPDVYILGVQSEWAVDGRKGLHPVNAGALSPATIADGIAVKRPGKITAPIIEAMVDKVTSVTEAQIASAIIKLLELERTVVEGAGAAGLAGLLDGHLPLDRRKTIVVISGSNIDMNVLSRLIDRDMGERGRLLRVRVSVPDRPGSLHTTTGILSQAGVNILEVIHDRSCADIPGNVDITFVLEIRNTLHREEVLNGLVKAGISVHEIQ